MQRPRYTNEELANMLLIYGECHKNERMAAVLYANRFPDKRHPTHVIRFFSIAEFANMARFTRQHVHETYLNAKKEWLLK